MSQWVITAGLEPDMIVCSTAVRARTTAQLIATELGGGVDVVEFSQLYLSDEQSYVEAIHTVGDEFSCLLLVGHNPTIEYLTNRLTGVAKEFPTGAIAHLRAPIEHWSQLSLDCGCELEDFCRPRELDL